MSRPLNIRFRPQPVVTAEIERSQDAVDDLLATNPNDWLRRLFSARVDVELRAPEDFQHAGLSEAGFRPLCSAWIRHPGPLERLESNVEVWIDPTATIRAEVILGRAVLSTLYDDGSVLLGIPDPLIGDWLSGPSCEVRVMDGCAADEIAGFARRARRRVGPRRKALLCATGDCYRRHVRLEVVCLSRRPTRGVVNGQLMYPMTALLATTMLAWRDDVVARSGLESINGRRRD